MLSIVETAHRDNLVKLKPSITSAKGRNAPEECSARCCENCHSTYASSPHWLQQSKLSQVASAESAADAQPNFP